MAMIEVNEETLRDFLSLVMSSNMVCFRCPWSDECDELDLEDMQDKDCVNLAIKCLQKKEENHD